MERVAYFVEHITCVLSHNPQYVGHKPLLAEGTIDLVIFNNHCQQESPLHYINILKI